MEGGREIRPWTHRIVFRTQVIFKNYSLPLIFYSELLMFSSEPLNLKSVKAYLWSYLILKTNSVDYHDGVHLVAIWKFWNIAKRFFILLRFVKMQKKLCYFTFNSKTKATFHGVDKLMHWDKKIIKRKVKMEMRRKGKEIAFQVRTYSF